MADVQGAYEDRFKGVRDVLAGNLDAGKDKNSFILIVGEGQAGGDGLSRVFGGKLKHGGTPVFTQWVLYG